ncbi:recombination-associated protein RdgC [Proteus mirabilis]|uniref:recombination-associated protein RdgC n=1 Tax=Proteus mirabilis TaxID=584 RepID=UPI000F5D1806|nr:recombination-associated protein RdgC [Proteus mirabilis]MDF7210907.1 recombination-associated protein RdgC [Proteus mirabilis]MDF7394850.1 recombination-associated protein RdgC [Proteus mirabilis]RQW35781.1 recombination-associated protein RdgC [Proteus mirabilis]UZE64635.1 recombination-associated protein RdgC [Proteus mirabilis]
MNFFKNAIVYRMTRDIQISAEQLEEALKTLAFIPCSSQDMSRTGCVSPLGNYGEMLTHVAGNQVLLCIKKEEKILPSTVIKETLQEKIEKLESEQGRKLKKTEKATLKDEVIHSLLPRAFSKYSQTQIWIDLDKQRIIVDASSSKRAEDSLALLRKTLGSLPVIPLHTEQPVELTLTEWVRNNDTPAGFMLHDEAELKAVLEKGGIAKFKKQDLASDEIATHIEAGKYVTKLSMDWQDRIKFTLTDSLMLKKISLSDVLKEHNDDIHHDDYAQRFDADFILFTGEFSVLIDELVSALGGESKA